MMNWKLWLTGELPAEALDMIERNTASDILILEGRSVLTDDEMERLELALFTQSWVDQVRRERAAK